MYNIVVSIVVTVLKSGNSYRTLMHMLQLAAMDTEVGGE